MKMLCIAKNKWRNPITGIFFDGPAFGDDVNSIETFDNNGKAYYNLKEYPSDYYYNANRFIPLSDLDEKIIHDIKPLEHATINPNDTIPSRSFLF